MIASGLISLINLSQKEANLEIDQITLFILTSLYDQLKTILENVKLLYKTSALTTKFKYQQFIYLNIQMKGLLRLYFTVLLLNLLVVSCIFFTKFENIARSKVQTSNYASATQYVDGFLIVSLIMISIQMILLLLGLPFAKQPFSIQLLFQILGVICYGLYILLRMPYQTISYIWGVFGFIPFIFAIASLIYRSIGYKKYSILNYSEDIKSPLKREGQ